MLPRPHLETLTARVRLRWITTPHNYSPQMPTSHMAHHLGRTPLPAAVGRVRVVDPGLRVNVEAGLRMPRSTRSVPMATLRNRGRTPQLHSSPLGSILTRMRVGRRRRTSR